MNAKKYSIILFFSFLSITAQEVIDQSQLTYNTYGILGIEEIGQGFTAGSSNQITKIEILMDCGSSLGCTGQQYNFSLYDADSDFKPVGNALFSEAGSGFNGGDGTPVWQIFQLENGPTMVMGNRYVIVVTDNGNFSDFGWLRSTTDTYSGGQVIYRASGSTNLWNTLISSDSVFRVWVDGTLGIEEQLFSESIIRTFFNSSSKVIRIESDVNFEASLYDLMGREVMNFDVSSYDTNSFVVPTLSKGIYVIKSKTENVIFSKKICIR